MSLSVQISRSHSFSRICGSPSLLSSRVFPSLRLNYPSLSLFYEAVSISCSNNHMEEFYVKTYCTDHTAEHDSGRQPR